MLLILDNYDSFTWNLAHTIEALGASFEVVRNDQLSIEDAGKYNALLLSPGPGLPEEAGIMQYIIRSYATEKPVLGVCLGMQGIAECFGALLKQMPNVRHGVEDRVLIKDAKCPLFRDIPTPFKAGRYHSWVVDEQTMPDCLVTTATDENGTIMAIKHRHLPVFGVQFHPESIMTKHGRKILSNWLELVGF